MIQPVRPPETENSPKGAVYSLQILRGVAAVLVMLYHYAHYLRTVPPGRDFAFNLFTGGYVGVDIFFLISGFIIVYSTEHSEHASLPDFLIRRFFRVVPLAQLATLLYFAVITAKPSGQVLLRSLCFFPIANIDPPKYGFPVVGQEWTLFYELFYYLIFAAALAFTHRHRALASAAALAAAVIGFQLALGGGVSLRANAVYLPASWRGIIPPELIGAMGNPLLLEFAVGMALASAYRRAERISLSPASKFASQGIGLVLIGLFIGSYLSQANPGNGLLDKGQGAMCLVAGALLLEVSLRGGRRGRISECALTGFLWLGAISYPLYLVHMGIGDRLLRFLCSFFFETTLGGVPQVVCLFCLSVLLASFAHVFVERPLIRLGRRLIDIRHGSFRPRAG